MDPNAQTLQSEFRAGPNQRIVVYHVQDTGQELDAIAIFSEIAEDAGRRAAAGQRIVSMTTLPLRHSAAYIGREGSGYQTKASIAVVYEEQPT